MPATPMMSNIIADNGSIERDSAPKSGDANSMMVIGDAPIKTPMAGMAMATVVIPTAPNATHTFVRNGAENIATTNAANAKRR